MYCYLYLLLKVIQINIRDNLIQLQLQLHSGAKVFYINDKFNFTALKQTFELELATAVELDFMGQSLTHEDNVAIYLLKDKLSKPIQIYVGKQTYDLIPAYQLKQAESLKNLPNLKFTPQPYYHEQLSQNIDPSHANTLSWLLNQINFYFSQKKDLKLTQSEVTKLISDCTGLYASPVKEKLFVIQHQLNLINAELNRLKKQKLSMDVEANELGWKWVKGIFILSVIQFIAFYWGIYIQWDWEVCEPVTYSIQMLSVLVGMRFYWKYRKSRDMESVLQSFTLKKLKQQRAWRDRYDHLRETIALKEDQKLKLDMKMLIFRNRINYHHYIQTIGDKSLI